MRDYFTFSKLVIFSKCRCHRVVFTWVFFLSLLWELAHDRIYNLLGKDFFELGAITQKGYW